MSATPSVPGPSNGSAQSKSLTDRVLARVNDAASVGDPRARNGRAKPRRSTRASTLRDAERGQTAAQEREARALRRVFVDLGDSYRAYRKRTGEPVSADVHAAADRFRRERNVTALISVAASLDELDILPW